MPGATIGLDLGTSTVLVYMAGKGIVLREPSVVAFDVETGEIVSIGYEAFKMLGRTSSRIVVTHPLENGVVADFELTREMIRYFLQKVCEYKVFKPKVIISVPNYVTIVEKRAVADAAKEAGARKTYVIEEALAAAIGAGVDISAPHGCCVVDVGGGTTDIGIISLNGIAVSSSIKVAGNTFDDEIIRYLRSKHNVLVGERTAEKIKTEIGSLVPLDTELKTVAKGRNLLTGLPQSVEVSSTELLEPLRAVAMQIVEAIKDVLEQATPELICDLFEDGLVLTGGGSLIKGMPELILQETGVSVRVPEDPVACVVKGTGMALKYADLLFEE